MLGFGPPSDPQARREWWRRQIQRQKQSRLSVAEFCRRLGVRTVTFYAWKRRLREGPTAAPPPSNRAGPAHRAAAAAFLPVSIRDADTGGHLEVEFPNACIVRLDGCVDPKLLHVAIRAAGQLGDTGKGAR